MCEQCQLKQESDRLMWVAIRRALLMAASAIAKRYPEGDDTRQERRAA